MTLPQMVVLRIRHQLHYSDDMAKKRAKKAVKPPYDPKRHHGAASVGFPAGVSLPPWQAVAGEELVLDLVVRTTGGKGRGINIAIKIIDPMLRDERAKAKHGSNRGFAPSASRRLTR